MDLQTNILRLKLLHDVSKKQIIGIGLWIRRVTLIGQARPA